MSNNSEDITINDLTIHNKESSIQFEAKNPFLIGVAGGTASGKVRIQTIIMFNHSDASKVLKARISKTHIVNCL